jgi:hypothetical protein|tara:strand:+ start:309 stop:743 length:435 start_codon:yes stop_codon:yes gene_type:complete
MALPDLTGQNIENTYQRVLHTNGTNLFNGTGSIVNVSNINANAEFNELIVNGTTQFFEPVTFTDGVTMQGNLVITGSLSAVGTVTAINIVNTTNTTSGLKFNPTSTDVLSNLIVTGSITSSGDISSSGTITATSFVGTVDGGSF